jgi:hypothetical protein
VLGVVQEGKVEPLLLSDPDLLDKPRDCDCDCDFIPFFLSISVKVLGRGCWFLFVRLCELSRTDVSRLSNVPDARLLLGTATWRNQIR